MTQTRIEIEEHQSDRWVATVEGGTGMDVRRVLVRATSFDEVILAVVEAHAGMRPASTGIPVYRDMVEKAEISEGEWRAGVPRGGDTEADWRASPEREALMVEGEAMGLTIDRRWGEYRLREAVNEVRARHNG